MRVHRSLNLEATARLELFARQHRCCLTESEARLWSPLKARQLGVSFRRQVPVGGRFIADFCAPSIGLIVAVDGGATRSESLQMLAVIGSHAGLGIASFGSKPRWCFAISLPRSRSFARRFKSPAHSARAV